MRKAPVVEARVWDMGFRWEASGSRPADSCGSANLDIRSRGETVANVSFDAEEGATTRVFRSPAVVVLAIKAYSPLWSFLPQLIKQCCPGCVPPCALQGLDHPSIALTAFLSASIKSPRF